MEVDSPSPTKTTSTEKKDVRYDVEFTRAIKENHGHPIVDVAWCPFKGGEAYYATVGANQVMIYDCEVRGNFISTLMNYRNWHLKTMKNKYIILKENLEKNHPDELEKKSFNAVCWMRRYRDFWVCAADRANQIHILSLCNTKCIKIIKMEATVMELMPHSMYPNILCTIDEENQCRFINTLTEEVIYSLPDKICRMRFSPSGNKFIGVLMNGNIREYAQKVEFKEQDDDDTKADDDEDEDMDMASNTNSNSNSNSTTKTKKKKSNKKLVVEALNTYKLEDKGTNVADIQYRDEDIIIAGNEDGEFKMVNMGTTTLMHQWKVAGDIEKGNVSKFDVKKDCVVYGNGAHQVQVYDVVQQKLIRRVDTGRGRKLPMNFATFCKNHPQSIMMVADNIVMKFDPIELVKDYFPSTADFAVQYRGEEPCFTEVKTVKYEAEKEEH